MLIFIAKIDVILTRFLIVFLISLPLLKLQVSSVGVTGARTSVSERVQTLLKDIKEVDLCKPDHVYHFLTNQFNKLEFTFYPSLVSKQMF